MKYYIKTFGCQMNVSDSERLASFLEENNLSPTSKIAEADLVVFNTCGIKQTAENRAYSMINNLRKPELKAKSRKLKTIIMTGCLANRRDVQKRMKSKVDLFTEIKNFPKSVSSILHGVSFINSRMQDTKYKIQNTKNILSKEEIDYLSINPKYTNSFQAYVPIMTGCNNFCAYCVVPHARGREVSRPTKEIIQEVKGLIKNGYKHIFLLGQNVNSYANQKETFSSLLKKINAIPGDFWISFTSNHPKDVTDEMIKAVSECEKVCENFHLPIQAGNDEVLRKMNRRYTATDYLKTIEKIKCAFKKNKPDALFAISSDIIVGFPGETKAQFLESADIMKKAEYDMVYFGQFSPRPGTAAWEMKDDVSQKEKERREKYLNEILKKTAFSNNQKYLEKKIEVLIETCRSRATGEKEKDGPVKSDESDHRVKLYFGKTRTGKNVKVTIPKNCHPEPVEGSLIGKIIKVKITKIGIWNLEGKLIK